MLIERPDGDFSAFLQSIGTVMFLNNWFPTKSDLESYPHIELTYCQHWNTHNIEFPQTKYSLQEEVEGRNVSKVKICFSGETPGDTDFPLDGDTRGDFRSNIEEVVVRAGMDDFHRRLVAGVDVTATHALYILTANRGVVVHAGMTDFHRRLVAGVDVTATHASAILNVNIDKKREISLAVSSKDKKREILIVVSSKDRKREILLAVSSKDRK